jgi:hypothetical protein
LGFPARKKNRPVETGALWKRWKNQRAKAIFPVFPQPLGKLSAQSAPSFPQFPTGPTPSADHLKKEDFLSKDMESTPVYF